MSNDPDAEAEFEQRFKGLVKGKTRAQVVVMLRESLREQASLEREVEYLRGYATPPAKVEDFPDQASEVVRIARPTKWFAWTGTPEQLIRLESVIETSLQAHFNSHRVGTRPSQLDKLVGLDASYRVETEVLIAQKSEVRKKGRATSALNDVEPQAIKSVSIGNQPSYGIEKSNLPLLQLRLGKDASFHFDGIELTLEASDPDWIAATLDRIDEQIRRGKPIWAWLRRREGFGLMVVGVVGFSEALLLRITPSPSGSVVALVAEISGFAGVGIAYTLRRFVFRGFEVVEKGSKTKAARIATGAAALIALVSGLESLLR